MRSRGVPVRTSSIARGLAIAAVLLVACQATEPAPATSQPAVLPSGARSATPTPTAKAPLGGTLRVALAAPIGSLDPQLAGANPTVASQIFEGLVAPGPNGPVAALATKWLVAADGRTWTFTLRDGVAFHDGSPLDGPAVAKSLGQIDDPLIAKAEALDGRTVVLTTRIAYGPFLSALATSPYFVVSAASRTSGTGPFRVPPGGEGVRPVVLERNDRYWRADASGQKLPYLDKLSFTAIPDPATRLASIRAGNVDFVQDLALGDIGTIRTDPSLQLVRRPETMVLYLGLNLSVPPLDDLRVRQAIAASLNPRSLVDRLYAGAAIAASQFPPPAMLGYDDSVTEFAKADPAAAKKLLSDSAHPNLDLDLWYVLDGNVTVPDMRRVTEAVAADLAAGGMSAEPKTIDPVTFGVNVRENRYPAWIGLAATTTFDPDELLGAFFIPKVGTTGADEPTEAGGWINAEVSGLLRKARSEPDQSKRSELYKQVSKIVQREIPRIPLVWSAPPAAATKRVVNPTGGLFVEVGIGK